MAGLNFAFTADNKNFMNALNEIQKGVEDTSRRIEAEGVNIEKFFNRIRDLSAISFAGVGLSGFINKIKDTRAYFQDIESSMRVFLGNAEKANEFTAKLQDYAYYNMFEFADLASASKQLIAYGNDVENIIPTIHKLSEVAIATNVPLEEMVRLYNRAKSTGVVGSQDIASWASKGLILKDVMKEMGTYVEGQTISFKQLNEVLDKVTSEGGMFHGIQEAQMTNISANIGQLQDNLSLMFNEIGTYLQEPIYEVLQFGSDVIDHWKEVGFAIASLASAAGIQKGVELATTTIDRTASQAMYAAEIAQLKELLPEKEAEEKTSLQQAVASGHLTEEKAKEIEQLREEADAYREVLAEKVKNAEADLASASNDVNDLTDWKDELDDKISKTQEWMDSLADNAESLEDLADCEEYLTGMDELETLESERNSVATELNTATQRQNAASRNLAAASAEHEAAATSISTAATTNENFATRLLITAKTLLAKAQAKVNAVIAANPYAVAIAATAALGYAVYKLVTYQNDYQKSISRLDDSEKEYNKSIMQEQHQIDVLFGKLKNAKKGTQEYNDAKNTIIKNYGSYLSKLGDEKNALNDITKAYNEVKEAAQQAAKARALNSYLEKEDSQYIEDQADNYEEIRQIVIDTKGETFADIHEQDLRDIVEGRKKINQEFLSQFDNYVTANGITYNANKLASAIGISDKRRENYNNAVKEGENRYGIKREELIRPEEGVKGGADPRTDKDKLTQELDAKIKQYNQLKKGSAESLSLLKEIHSLEKQVAEYNDYKSQNKNSQSASQRLAKTAAEEQQLTDVLKTQAEERLRQQQDYEYELWQNRIDLMDDGEAKTLAQMQLNNAKELTALKQRQQQEIQAEIARQKAVFDAQEEVNASKNKQYAKKVFDPTRDVDQSGIDTINQRYEQLYADLEAKQAKAEQDRLDAAKESMNAYLQEFGNYQQKRLAIQEEYETKISEAQNEGQRMQLMAQRNQKISDLDFNEWQDNGGMALAFGDVSKLSGDTIKGLISKMEEYRSKVIATFDPDKIQKFEDALNNLRMADVDMQFSFGGDSDIVESLKERLALIQQINDEEANTTALQNQKAELEQQLNDLNAKALTPTPNTTAIGPDGQPAEQTGVGMTEEDVKLAEELRVKIMQIGNLLTKSTTNSQQLNSQLKQMKKVKFADVQKFSKNLLNAAKNAASLAEIFDDDIADAISSGIEKVEGLIDVFDTVSSNIEALAKSGKDVVKSTVDASEQIVDGASAGMKSSVAATSTSLSTMEKASAILAIIGAAIQLATMVASLFNSDSKHEKNIQALQDQIDALQNSYDKLGRAVDNAYSTDASKLIDQQNTLLQQQKVLIEQQIAEEKAKKNTDDEKIKEYTERLEEIDEALEDNKANAKEAIIGEDIKSAISEFADAYASAWEDGTDAAAESMSAVKNILKSALNELLKKNLQPKVQEFYDLVAKYAEDGFTEYELRGLDVIKRQIDAASESLEEQFALIEDRYKDLDELKEELTDISFDSLRDDFKSQLADMETSAADFADSFSDMLRNALIEGLMDNKYDAMLKEWYDEFAEAMDDQTLSNEERDSLRQKYESIINQGIADRDAVSEIVGGGAYSQEASTGGWDAMGQDQAEELNGRFTALTELQVISNDLQQTQNTLAAQILATLQSMSLLSGTSNDSDPTLLAIKDMMFLQTGYLEDIAKYTKILNTVDERLATLNNMIDKKL